MLLLLLLSFVGSVFGGKRGNVSNVHGVYYFPSVIGINPLSSAGQTDLYNDYFTPVHERDLNLIGQVGNYIRLSGSATRYLTTDFLDLCQERNIGVILTWSFMEYNLRVNDIRTWKTLIALEFADFVRKFRSHSAVKMWSFGDLYDPIFGQDDQNEHPDSTDYMGKLINTLLYPLYGDLVRLTVDNPKPIGVSFYVNTGDSTALAQTNMMIREINNMMPDLDFWIPVFTGEDLLSSSVYSFRVPGDMWAALDPTSTASRKAIIVQFTNTAYQESQFRRDVLSQNINAAVVLDKVLNPTQNVPGSTTRTPAINLAGIIFQEWSDQWWRGDTAYGCNSGLSQPFFQSRCSRGFQGMVAQYNQFGQHCIKMRPVVTLFGRAYQYRYSNAWNAKNAYTAMKNAAFFNGSVVPQFGDLVPDQDVCVMIWPSFFSTHDLVPDFFFSLVGLGGVALFLWLKWVRRNRQEQKEIQQYLDAGQIKKQDAKHKEEKKAAESKKDDKAPPPPPPEKDEDKTLKTAELEIPRSKIERELDITQSRVRVSMSSTRPIPTSGGPWVNNSAIKADKKMNAFLLELYLREHVRKAKLNVDQMIEHEFKVLQTLADHALIMGMPNLNAIHSRAVKIVHTRMLEGYTCWLDRNNASDQRPPTICEYAELLVFRLMVSVAEHIAHCPERLAQVFHSVLEKFEGDVLNIDLDALQRGLEGPLSINEGTVNFDDINDCGILNEKDLRKTWFESPGPAVVLDYLRDYDVIFFFKLWIFCLACMWRLELWDPEGFLYPFCQIESSLFVGAELTLFLYHTFFQNRSFPKDRVWGMCTAGVLGGFMLAGVPILEQTLGLLIPCIIYASCRVVYCVLPHQIFKFITQRDTAQFYSTHIRGRLKKKAAKSDADEKANSSLYMEHTHWQSIFFWAFTFVLTLLVEVYLIVPIASYLNYNSICHDSRMERCFEGELIIANNLCISCYTAVTLAYCLMMVTVFSDTPLVFYFSVSLFGYYKGQIRKVQNVYATEACQVDLRANGAERKNIEAVLGKWETNSCEIWCAMIEELYLRDLICDSDRIKLQTPGKKWEFSQMNAEPRERLSFWLQTIKSMARQAKRHKDQAGLDEAQRAKLKSITQHDADMQAEVSVIDGLNKKDKSDASSMRRRQAQNSGSQWKGALYVTKGSSDLYRDRQMGKVSIHRDNMSESGMSEEAPGVCWEPAVEDSFSMKGGPNYLGDIEDAKSAKRKSEKKVPGKTGKEGGRYAKLNSENEIEIGDKEGMNPFDLTDEEQMDRDLRSIPRISHVITCYSETVLLSMDYLRDRNGNLSNLEHMINLSEYRKEWAFMEERFRTLNSCEPSYDVLVEFLNLRYLTEEDSYDALETALVREVRLWASYRAQTIIRTIRGALSYHDALLKRFEGFEQKDGKECDLRLNDFVELIVAHQTYGAYPRAGSPVAEIDGWKNRRLDMEWILKHWQNYPIFLVYDYAAPPPPSKRKPPKEASEDFDYYWSEQCLSFWEEDEKELEAYWKHRADEYELKGLTGTPNFTNATCIKCMKDGVLKLVAVLPRMLPLRIGKKDKTQGKAANQINALRCVSGHVIQVSDANMDGWIGEGFKLPFITRMFTDGDVSRRWVGDRTSVLYRIIGFREYIFTGPLGPVGIAMASSEFTFGTLFQRVLSDPLNVRMHYGHPDFFDAFWVINRGTLSKASPRLNLSEDVFSGYNTVLRNEKITHSDGLEWQKGREVVFTASSGFMVKITAGSVAIMRTRDMKMMQKSLSFTKKLSLYFGGIGGFVLHLLIDYSILLYVMFFTCASYATITLADVQSAGSSLGLEWLVGLGLVTSLGYMTEMMLEHGWGAGLFQVLKSLPITSLFYMFQNKCMAHAIIDSVRTGDAQYFDSGRPNAFDHYSLRTMYDFYAESHYYPALRIFGLIYFYYLFVGLSGGALPMFLVLASLTSWIVAPVVFCPQISNLNIVTQDTVEVMNFVFAVRDKLDAKSGKESLDKFWRLKEVAFHNQEMLGTRVIWWVGLLLPCLLLWTLAFSILIDYAMLFTWVWAMHVIVTAIFNFSNYTNVVRGVWYFIPLVGTLLISLWTPGPQMFSTEVMLGAVLFMSLIRVIHWLLLILLTVWYKLINCRASAETKKAREVSYNNIVGHCFFLFFDYHIHLYAGICVCVTQAVFQMTLMVVAWVVDWILRFYHLQQVHSAADYNRMYGDVKVVS